MRLAAALGANEPAAATLAGCRVLSRRGTFLICREPAAAVDIKLAEGRVDWDGRFRIEVTDGGGCEIRRLGRSGWAQVTAAAPDLRTCPIPPPVRPALPALWRDERVVCVPHAGYRDVADAKLPQVGNIYFCPVRPLASAPFAIGGGRPIL